MQTQGNRAWNLILTVTSKVYWVIRLGYSDALKCKYYLEDEIVAEQESIYMCRL